MEQEESTFLTSDYTTKLQSARYKINTQKFLAFLYTNNEKSERGIEDTILFTIATKE